MCSNEGSKNDNKNCSKTRTKTSGPDPTTQNEQSQQRLAFKVGKKRNWVLAAITKRLNAMMSGLSATISRRLSRSSFLLAVLMVSSMMNVARAEEAECLLDKPRMITLEELAS
jgi:hypothetical protein